ncbi:hypothetical protein Tco_1167236 [Tanacetum coccineum]
MLNRILRAVLGQQVNGACSKNFWPGACFKALVNARDLIEAPALGLTFIAILVIILLGCALGAYIESRWNIKTSIETEFPAIVFNDSLTFEETPSCEPTVSPLNDNKIDFRISFDESDDEDYTMIYDKNSFSYKIIYVNDLKTDSENNNDKVNMPSSHEPTVSCFDDLDFFKDFENEFPAIVYNDALTSKSDFLTEPTVSPQHIDEFNLKDETSLSECDEEEQNILYFNDVFPFNIIYPGDSKLDKDNNDDKIDIKQSSGDMYVKPLPDLINTDVGAYEHGSNKLLETSHDTSNKFFKTKTFIKGLNFNIMTWNHLNKGMSFIFLIKNLYVPFGILFDPKLFYKDGIKLGQV